MCNFNNRILLVEPDAFRTNFLGPNNIQYAPFSERYKGTACEKMLDTLQGMDGKQTGNPAKAADRIFDVVTDQGMAEGTKPNLRLPLGSDCIRTVRAKLEHIKENFDELEENEGSTDGN